MSKTAVTTDKAPKAIGPYSQGIDIGTFVFVSGQTPIDPATGDLIKGGVPEQTARCLDNIENILKAAGLEMKNVVKTTVFMTDLKKFAEMNDVYAGRFALPHPARATVEVSGLPRGAAVEIEAIALR